MHTEVLEFLHKKFYVKMKCNFSGSLCSSSMAFTNKVLILMKYLLGFVSIVVVCDADDLKWW